uniref:Uncharacterized protein n=1 Tax=Trachysalambria curvirostris majanivirus TaxID=2984281 RepID=A0A9C7BII6_9VIRU|nr:MAG: hypothetical protein [Trachysalambria curvirostris majanivirus]
MFEKSELIINNLNKLLNICKKYRDLIDVYSVSIPKYTNNKVLKDCYINNKKLPNIDCKSHYSLKEIEDAVNIINYKDKSSVVAEEDLKLYNQLVDIIKMKLVLPTQYGYEGIEYNSENSEVISYQEYIKSTFNARFNKIIENINSKIEKNKTDLSKLIETLQDIDQILPNYKENSERNIDYIEIYSSNDEYTSSDEELCNFFNWMYKNK